MTAPIAPVLTRHLTRGGTLSPLDDLEEARRELRALLAVARAAQNARREVMVESSLARQDEIDDRLCMALARLDRLSRPSPKARTR